MSRIQEARLNAMFDLYESGERNPIKLIQAAENAHQETAHKIGRDSEKNFREHAEKLKVVKNVKHASAHYDHERKIDFWITIDWEKYTLEPIHLPVQVKSSDDQVEEFKNSNTFIALHGKILVLNTNPMFVKSMNKFKDRFFPELTRVLRLFREEEIDKAAIFTQY